MKHPKVAAPVVAPVATPAATPTPRRRTVAGFTLIEMLIVMALFSLVMLALGAAMRTIAQSEQRIDARLERSDEFRVAVAFLRSTLGRVSARKVLAGPELGASPFLFAAAASEVAWVGIMPARYGAGGRYFFHLGVEVVNDESALVLRFVPWTDTPTFPDWSQADSKVLVAGVESLAIQYEDAREQPPVWGAEWPLSDKKPERLPDRIEINMATASGAWPSLVVALRSVPGGAMLDGFVIGGSL